MKMQTTPFAERGSDHTATIGLLPRQKHAVINESCALRSLHLMSSSSNYATTSFWQMAASYYLTTLHFLVTTCQLQRDQTLPLSDKDVACEIMCVLGSCNILRDYACCNILSMCFCSPLSQLRKTRRLKI